MHPNELSLEWLYQAQLWKWATLMPDLQFIIHPGGKYENALVATLNLRSSFDLFFKGSAASVCPIQ